MVWNYRVIAQENEVGELTYGVHEVYYEDHKISDWSAQPNLLVADSYETLEAMKDRYLFAYGRPVLIESELLKALKEQGNQEIDII